VIVFTVNIDVATTVILQKMQTEFGPGLV